MKQAAERKHAALMESASNSLIGNSLIEVAVKKNGKRTQNEGLRTPDEWIIQRGENSKSKTEKRQKRDTIPVKFNKDFVERANEADD
jgi:hypothetical protein